MSIHWYVKGYVVVVMLLTLFNMAIGTHTLIPTTFLWCVSIRLHTLSLSLSLLARFFWNTAEIACGSDDFDILCVAVQKAGLAETLGGPGPFTVFAPNDAGFRKLLGEKPLTAALNTLSTETLADLLLYHVVAGDEIYFDELGCEHPLTMANGEKTWT
jgi:Fasciclin domain